VTKTINRRFIMNDLTAVRVEIVPIMIGVRDKIVEHAMRESEKGGFEAVGLLAGAKKDPRIGAVLPLNNHSSTPQDSFFVEPWEQWKAERALEDADLELRGYYHSHVVGEASPSKFDEQLARPKELMVIYSVAFGDIMAWRESEGSLHKVDLEPVDPDEDE
jgi:proteasome lid subunit RPN8/RPN11